MENNELMIKESREKIQAEYDENLLKSYPGQEDKIKAIGEALKALEKAGVPAYIFAKFGVQNPPFCNFIQFNNFSHFIEWGEDGEQSKETTLQCIEETYSFGASIAFWFSTHGNRDTEGWGPRAHEGLERLLKGFFDWKNDGVEPPEYTYVKTL